MRLALTVLALLLVLFTYSVCKVSSKSDELYEQIIQKKFASTGGKTNED